MMKKILVFTNCVLMLGFLAGSAIAQLSYNLDFLEAGNPGGIGTCETVLTPCSTSADCFGGTFACENAGLKTFDTTWTLDDGQTVEMDIWLSGSVPVIEDLVSGGAFITYDASQVSILSVMAYDTAATPTPGLWDAGFTSSFEVDEANPGEWFIAVAQFGCVVPYADGDVAIARVTFQCQGEGTSDIVVTTVPDFDTIVSCLGTTYDPQVSSSTVTMTQNAGAGCTVPEDCADDGNLCTTAFCVEGTCVYNPVDCDDGDPCTTDSCDPGTGGCVFSPVTCDDADECTTDSCDPATGECSNDSITCDDDGDPCTIDWCDPATGCVYSPNDCDDDNLCTDDSCDPGTGCLNIPNIDCSDAKPCTEDICNPSTGLCEYPAVDCDDGVECTVDSCDNDLGGCQNVPDDAVCNDDIDCTDDTCDPAEDCQNEDNCPIGEFCNGGANECQAPTCSITIDPSTANVQLLGTVQFDVVVDGTCAVEPSYTWDISDEGCAGDTTGSAIGSTVSANGLYTAGESTGMDIVRVTDESNGDICATAEVTVVTTTTTTAKPTTTTTIISGSCTEDADCDDGIDCTDDSCVEKACVNMPNDENCTDDGLYCNGEEVCDEEDGCTSSGDPCGPNETCDEETDTCGGACSVDVLSDSFLKSNWVLLPALIRIQTEGIEGLSFGTPVSFECDVPGPFSSILTLLKLVNPTTGIINVYALLWPAILTGNFNEDTESCTVTVGDCSDTGEFELNILSIGGIPLSE